MTTDGKTPFAEDLAEELRRMQRLRDAEFTTLIPVPRHDPRALDAMPDQTIDPQLLWFPETGRDRR